MRFALKSFFGGVSGLTLPLAGEGLEATGEDVEEANCSESRLDDALLPGEALLSERFFEIRPEENPAGRPPILGGFAGPPMGGDLIKPPMLTSCFGPTGGGLRLRSTLLFCFALLISAIQAGCWGGGATAFGLGDSGLLSALSSQLDFVGLHLLDSNVFDGLEGGGVCTRASCSTGTLSWSGLTPKGVCVRGVGRAGLAKLSVVDVVMLLFIELEVPGRS